MTFYLAILSLTLVQALTIEPKLGVTITPYAPHSSSSTPCPTNYHRDHNLTLLLFAGQTCAGPNISIALGPDPTDTCIYPNYDFLSAVVVYSANTSSTGGDTATRDEALLPYVVDIITDCEYGNSIAWGYECFSYDDASDPYNSYATVPSS